MNQFGELYENINLKDYNTYKIGGKAKYIVKPYDISNLIKLIQYLRDNEIKYLILGKGSNVILPDSDFDGVLILLNNLNNLEINGDMVSASSGISLNTFINKLVSHGLGGLESLCGIPGTIGGAIVQNAGCYGQSIGDRLENVTYLEDGNIYTIKKEECEFGYRMSIFKKDKKKIILSATFKLEYKEEEILKEIIKENQKTRIQKQPLEYPNAGSVFKNPPGMSAGKLIDDLGLKGYNINDAYISEKHANFIINKGNASSKDIIGLIDYIKDKVREKYDIDLELEQEIIKF